MNQSDAVFQMFIAATLANFIWWLICRPKSREKSSEICLPNDEKLKRLEREINQLRLKVDQLKAPSEDGRYINVSPGQVEARSSKP